MITRPLDDMTVLELGGIGPVPFAGMLLADLGARVVRVQRPGDSGAIPAEVDLLGRGKTPLAADLKTAEGVDAVLAVVDRADVLVEGLRPGVAERLGVGPDTCAARNAGLVYGRMTGWGQDGPMASRAGHDINYLALTGALHAMGEAGRPPVPPLNLVGDFGGGATYLVMGVLAALLDRQRTGRGRVVDAAMVDGIASMLSMTWSLVNAGAWSDERGVNLLDGGAPFYSTYACADGGHVAVGAIEPQFWAALLETVGLDDMPPQHDRSSWPEARRRLSETFATRGRDEWAAAFDGVDACVTPVLSLAEAARDPHLLARGTYAGDAGAVRPGAAPRFLEP